MKFKVNQTLYNKLKKQFRFNNHKKYHKYFDEWVVNVTHSQIYNYNNEYWIDKKYY